MGQTYFPFDSGQGANTTENQWGLMAQNWLATGVLKGKLNELSVYADSTGMQAKVKTGQAWVQGYFYQSDAEVVLPITTADPTNPRIDRVIVRVDWTANTIQLAVLQGVPAVSPSAPALTQNSTIWEISLAQVRVNATVTTIAAVNVTDERTFSQNADANQTPWLSLTLQNGWLGPVAPYTPPQYRKDNFGNVRLMGRLSNGTATAGTVIATLPAGYRPQYRMSFSVLTNNGSDQLGQIDIDTGGNLILMLGYNGLLGLESIPPFPAFY